jgi:hypothetical protein
VNVTRRAPKVPTEILSVFGQIEAAAANHLIREGRAKRIEFKDIPRSAAYNDVNKPAEFAVVLRGSAIREFNDVVASLRA